MISSALCDGRLPEAVSSVVVGDPSNSWPSIPTRELKPVSDILNRTSVTTVKGRYLSCRAVKGRAGRPWTSL
jgi:hypothetical protein